jgi:hypothetical protein
MSLFSKLVDERFLEYRRRSTSVAGIAGAIVAWALFEYRWFFCHVWSGISSRFSSSSRPSSWA